MRSCVVVVLDSLRYDCAVDAGWASSLAWLGPVERRWSYATWTLPAHLNLGCGLLPHRDEPGRLAVDAYRDEFRGWSRRLGVEVDRAALAPGLWLPDHLQQAHRYWTQALVALPCLNRDTPFGRGWRHHRLADQLDSLDEQVDHAAATARDVGTAFTLVNAGDTHYPYGVAGLPRLSGLHGDDGSAPLGWFDARNLRALRDAQVAAAARAAAVLRRLPDVLPTGTAVVVTSDHGELFGEGGRFGHGPFCAPELFAVPYAEGVVGVRG